MRKIIALGIMLLFLGMTISSSVGFNLEKQSIKPLSSGNILYVGGNGTGNYSKIQDAIDNASDGDTVYVYNGTYVENVVVDKSINLTGEDKGTTIIDGNGTGDVINITSDWVNISGFKIKRSGNYPDTGIDISSNHNTIKDNTIKYNWGGLGLISDCNNNIIKGNIISANYYGIYFSKSSNNSIIGNYISNNQYGLTLIYDSCGNTVTRNNITSNHQYGIELFWSNNKAITENIISNNGDGILIYHSSNNIITGNNITSNSYYGIKFDYCSDGNTITSNNISKNRDGIYLQDSSNNNIIYHNNLINNTQNAYDECNNSWDDGYPSGGNYWDDYNGTDGNGDGIGDTPYPIPGGDNEDRYPLMEPYGNGDENETFFGTLGPICPLLNIVEIELIDGNESQMQKIEKILNNRILQFIIPYWWGYINVTELDFTITYNKEIPKIPFWLNFYYATILTENENETFIDKPHKVTVKGLNGTFVISRGQLFKFRPPYFLFAGDTYDEVTIELIERGRV